MEIAIILSGIGTSLTSLLGGWDGILRVLIYCIVGDYILGVAAAFKNHCLDSRVSFWGGINKLMVLGLVAFAVILDGALELPSPYIRTAVIWFYVGREGLSMIENSGKLGFPWPDFVVHLLEQLKGKGNAGKGSKQ